MTKLTKKISFNVDEETYNQVQTLPRGVNLSDILRATLEKVLRKHAFEKQSTAEKMIGEAIMR